MVNFTHSAFLSLVTSLMFSRNAGPAYLSENYFILTTVFNSTDPINSAACAGDFGGCGRPKIIYNEQSKKYVLYSFASRLSAPGTIPVFTSDSLTSGYTFAGYSHVSGVPENYVIEDLGLSVIDGIGYVIWTQFDYKQTLSLGGLAGYSSIYPPFIQTLNLQRLTQDFLNTTGTNILVVQGSYPVYENSSNIIDGQVEAPDFFKRGGHYYAIGSSKGDDFVDHKVSLIMAQALATTATNLS